MQAQMTEANVAEGEEAARPLAKSASASAIIMTGEEKDQEEDQQLTHIAQKKGCQPLPSQFSSTNSLSLLIHLSFLP